MLQKIKCHQNWNVTKTEMSPKLKCLTKLKYHKNWNITRTEMSMILALIILVLFTDNLAFSKLTDNSALSPNLQLIQLFLQIYSQFASFSKCTIKCLIYLTPK